MGQWIGLLAWVMALAAVAASKPGVVGEYFRFSGNPGKDTAIEGKKPFYVKVDKQVRFPEVPGNFNGSKLADNFIVRWTSKLKVDKAKTTAEKSLEKEHKQNATQFVSSLVAVQGG